MRMLGHAIPIIASWRAIVDLRLATTEGRDVQQLVQH